MREPLHVDPDGIPPRGAHRSSESGSYLVNSGYYGEVGASGSIAEWSIEYVDALADARELWAAGDRIDRIVATLEPASPYSSEAIAGETFLFGRPPGQESIPRCRLSARRGDDGGWVIRDYDWRRWEARLDDPRFDG